MVAKNKAVLGEGRAGGTAGYAREGSENSFASGHHGPRYQNPLSPIGIA